MQRVLLPPSRRRLAGLSIAARYQAAKTEAGVGGDLYAEQDTRRSGCASCSQTCAAWDSGRHRVRPRGRVPRGGTPGADLVVLAERLEDALDRETQSPGALERRLATASSAEVAPGSTRLR